MPVDVRILPHEGLVYVRYSGRAGLAETKEAFAAFLSHPDFRPGLKQLLDLSAVTDFDRDQAAFMRLQAGMTEGIMAAGDEVLLVFYAPDKVQREMAEQAHRTWAGLAHIVPVIVTDEAAALETLGLRAASIADLLAGAR